MFQVIKFRGCDMNYVQKQSKTCLCICMKSFDLTMYSKYIIIYIVLQIIKTKIYNMLTR
jgi:hypothetical protein